MFKGSGTIRVYPRFNARKRRAQSTESTPVLPPSNVVPRLLWKSTVVLCIGLAGVIGVLMLVLHLAVPATRANAFTPYLNIYPGLLLATLDSAACSEYSASPYTHEQECKLRLLQPNRDGLCEVIVTIYTGQVGKIRYQCDGLYVGDLVGQWGRPDEITPVTGGYILRWSAKGIIATARGSHWFHYQLPVEGILHR